MHGVQGIPIRYGYQLKLWYWYVNKVRFILSYLDLLFYQRYFTAKRRLLCKNCTRNQKIKLKHLQKRNWSKFLGYRKILKNFDIKQFIINRGTDIRRVVCMNVISIWTAAYFYGSLNEICKKFLESSDGQYT